MNLFGMVINRCEQKNRLNRHYCSKFTNSLNSLSKSLSRGKKREQLPCERFLQGFGFSHAFLPPVSHREKSGKF